ncbi:peroxiredoxin 1 [Malassezia yamatoensis]|uniref:Peroxiredoxin 1 n=1 Tax=Malassezia yamatoensis TaxID=253288 RepID=A0AAJ5YW71_9BASI|nr:peroxiredoxin 1 [Malassezia yamatoensis]
MPALRLGSIVPDFVSDTTHGTIQFHEWIGDSWAVLFSHPGDFTPVCTTELGEVARLQPEFEKRKVKVIGLSVDDVSKHKKWIEDINEVAQTSLSFPIIGDANRAVASEYDMLDALDPTNRDAAGMPFTVRDVLVIDPQKILRLKISYPASTGRHFKEILRVIDSLQLGDKHRVTTPVNWQPGDKVIIHPSVSNDLADTLFPNYETVKPYLRYTNDPSI